MNKRVMLNGKLSSLWAIVFVLLAFAYWQPSTTQAQWTSGSGNTTTTDNVGIGTSTPSRKLTISNNTLPIIGFNETGAANDVKRWVVLAYGGNFYFQSVNDAETAGQTWLQANRSGLNVTSVSFPNSNLGIGTATPTYRLQITGDNSTSYPILKFQNTQTNGHSWWLYSGAFGSPGAFGIYDETAGAYRMLFDGSGNVGIGTSGPSYKLEVQGSSSNSEVTLLNLLNTDASGGTTNTKNTSFTIQGKDSVNTTKTTFKLNVISSDKDFSQGADVAISSLASGQYTLSERMRITASGNVGIGTALPTYKLDVAGSINGSGLCIAGDCKTSWSQVSGSGSSQWSNGTGGIYYGTGNVGIGKTPSDTVRLDVEGNLSATGTITGETIYAKYQDVAEWVSSRQKLTAGTVVILDPERTNQVIASTESYDTRVAGVVSDSPGMILGESGEGKVKVATTGRVRVRVDASRGPIKIGDLLVTSDKEGIAMKSEPILMQGRRIHVPGTIIGKALEPLESGVGEIKVLLSLQ